MPHELPLTKTNRLRLSEAFRHNPRVDCSIDCVVEGQMGRAYVDDPENPTAWRITVGPFWYFAGDASGPGGRTAAGMRAARPLAKLGRGQSGILYDCREVGVYTGRDV